MDCPVIGISGYADRSARPPNVSVFALARTYVRAVTLGGGAPVIIPPYLEGCPLRGAFDGIDGLLLSGGGDIHPSSFGEADSGLLWRIDRKRDHAELSLARWALREGLPTLAICRGIQTLNVAVGGTLIQDIPTQVPNALSHSSISGRPMPEVAHTVDVDPGSRLADLIGAGEVGVNSAHHQAVKVIGSGLVAVARAPDGVIEGVEAPAHPFCVGVQWHPEAMAEGTPIMRRLFEGLVRAAQS
jgi:putative glutamine amidotransferase